MWRAKGGLKGPGWLASPAMWPRLPVPIAAAQLGPIVPEITPHSSHWYMPPPW